MPDETNERRAGTRPGREPKAAKPRVKLTIDGHQIEAEVGANLIEAARRAGVKIPHFCWHPKLSVAASCRMCLVEASSSPKLVPACQTRAAEGMEVRTRTPAVAQLRRSVLELLLLNHPVDCAICDQAGDCKLQDYYFRYDARPSRLKGPKRLADKRKVLGPDLVLDQERCILCSRCVRFMREIAGEPQLGVFGRGGAERVDTFPGRPLESNYDGNLVELCPVGALTLRDSRFKASAFHLSTAPSICTGCARGCGVWLDHLDGRIHRVRPRKNPAVNGPWMCDLGRLSYKETVHDRALEPKLGRTAQGRSAEPREAVREAAARLRPLRGSERLAFVISPKASLEEQLAACQLANAGLGLARVFVCGRPDAQGDRLLLRPDRNPNRAGLELAARAFGLSVEPFERLAEEIDSGRIGALYAVGEEFPTDPKLVASLLVDLDPVIVQAVRVGPVAGQAHVLLPASPSSESDGTLVNFEGRAQRFVAAFAPRGASRPHWAWAAMLLEELGAKPAWTGPGELFAQLGAALPGLEQFGWDDAPSALEHPRGLTTLPAAADGRHGIHRERSLP